MRTLGLCVSGIAALAEGWEVVVDSLGWGSLYSSTNLHGSKYSVVSLFHIALSFSCGTHFLRSIVTFWIVYLLLSDVESIYLIALVRLLLHEFYGALVFLRLLCPKFRNCFGYVSFWVTIFYVYSTALLTMKDSTFGILQKILTGWYSLTWFHFIPRMFCIAVWWKASS